MAFVLQDVDEEELINVTLVRSSAGACLRGRLKTSARAVALKLLKTDSCLSQMQEALAHGGECVTQVLQPVGVYRSRFLIGLLWDWMPEGSLHSLLYETNLYPDLPLALRLRILLDVAEGLQVLHAISLPHAALKTTNVLLDHQYHAKLCDWGCETLVDVRTRAPCFRDLAFLAPELLLGNLPGVKSDMYSFGVLMWETLNRRPSHEGLDQLQNLDVCAREGAEPGMVRNLLPLETPQGHALTQLMTRCWSVDPKQRPLAEDCVLELRKVLETLDPGAECRAVHLIRTCKERALQSCKHTATWELPIELNNLEGYGGCTGPKYLKSKTIPVTVPFSHKHNCVSHTNTVTRKSDESSSRGSPPSPAPARSLPPTAYCRNVGIHTAVRHCAGVLGIKHTRAAPPLNTPCSSPTSQTHTTVHPANQPLCPVSSGLTCCQLLQERRETIVHFMTEGRLNRLLDMLRARRAVTREDYEFITSAMTLSARTRCLLDTCACLGEKVAILVANTLGLVSMETMQGHARSRISPKGQVG
ncbi:receptor-interacting serine/threonine-protein kinase 2 [Tachysurus fulvidraco]|uniref:receptor-interacting serine/threonine-protein kinase 2 n=1 Tax=Tachysurus fulvidraco TaxID=1234273 RepID=UPI001FEE1EA2|nr:receptor-interacting serine/threonine-protein kinase 2 [Tachysurus fulvidraco]